MKIFRNKSFSTLRYHRRLYKLLTTEGIELNYFLKKEGPESLSAFYAFFCAWKHNQSFLFMTPRTTEESCYKKICFFEGEEVFLKGPEFEGSFVIPSDWKETVRADFPWSLDKALKVRVFLTKPSLSRLEFLEAKEQSTYDQALKKLILNFRTWLIENRSEGINGFYLISERLKLLGQNYDAEYLYKNATEISDYLNLSPISCELTDTSELLSLNDNLRQKCYNYELISKIKYESSLERNFWIDFFKNQIKSS